MAGVFDIEIADQQDQDNQISDDEYIDVADVKLFFDVKF